MTDSKDSAARHKGRIKDARGRMIAPIDVISLHLLRQYDIIEAEPLHAIVREKDLRITRAERMFLIVGIVAILAVASLFIYSVIVGDLGEAPYAKSSALAYFSAMPWLAWFIIRRARFHKIAPALLKYSRCPHCGYDLKGLPVDDADGATVCPECGCAWKVGEGAGSES